MAHSTEKLMITTYTQREMAQPAFVFAISLTSEGKLRTKGNWILCVDYRDETELLQICPSDCPDLKVGVECYYLIGKCQS